MRHWRTLQEIDVKCLNSRVNMPGSAHPESKSVTINFYDKENQVRRKLANVADYNQCSLYWLLWHFGAITQKNGYLRLKY